MFPFKTFLTTRNSFLLVTVALHDLYEKLMDKMTDLSFHILAETTSHGIPGK